MSAPSIINPPTTTGGTPVGGSGTAGTVPKWATTSTLGDSVITQSGTNIGIGVLSPPHKLDVGGAIGGGLYSDSSLEFLVSGNVALKANNILRLGYNGELNVVNGGSYSGNVGIGTTSPSTKLQILDTLGGSLGNTVDSLSIRSQEGGGVLNFNIGSYRSASTSTHGYYDMYLQRKVDASLQWYTAYRGEGAGATSTRSWSVGYGTQSSSNDALQIIGTSGISAKMVWNGGNVGIGTASPAAPLHISGNATSADASIAMTPVSGGRQWQLRSRQSGSLFDIYDVNVNAIRLTIDSNGNVGIGTASPVCALDVVGVIKTSGYTVATLPAGVVGQRAYVTDALAPTYLGALVGGGAVTCPVFYNGAAWVSA